MMQRQSIDKSESNELKPTPASGGDGSVFSNTSNSSPATPTARNRFPLVRTGNDSGYGTDYSPSPSSNTSSRHFVFNDDIVAGGNVSSRKDKEMLDLSKRLENIQVEPKKNLEIEGGFENICKQKPGDSEEDEFDEEVKNINANHNACQFELPCEDKVERPSAPLPCPIDIAVNGEQCIGAGDRSSKTSVKRPLLLRIENTVSNPESSQTRNVQANSHSLAEHMSRDRSHSMPNVRNLTEQEVGRQLRRLSDDFFNFHCNRRRQRTLSVESHAFPVRVAIDLYAGRTPTHRRTNSDADSDDTNSRRSAE